MEYETRIERVETSDLNESVISVPAGFNSDPALVELPIDNNADAAPEREHPLDVCALTARMSRGEEAAFHEFYNGYFNRLLRYLLVVTGGREENAREALQLTFVRVARHVRRFESEPAFWNWLTVLARSSVVDESRKRSRYQGLLARFFLERTPDASTESRNVDQRFLELVKEELAALPASERELIERKYFDNELVRGLASERQLTEKAVESQLLRIRRKLKTAVLDRLRNETDD